LGEAGKGTRSNAEFKRTQRRSIHGTASLRYPGPRPEVPRLADQVPACRLPAPAGAMERYRVMEWVDERLEGRK